ncbi:MAG: PrsW family intramembrane metalloprotease [Bacteroidales bacterium]|nr:PrsW family intramembrane metalloprotease [Bacteroidales bacterium]
MSWILMLSLLPVAAVLYYVYRKDHSPEPLRTLGYAFMWGCVSVIPAIIAELIFHSEDEFIEMYINVALVEESVKLAVLLLYIWKHADFNDSFDAIVYSVTVSLGFAAIENIMYVFQGGLSVAILRALLSIPGHASFAILMGLFFARAKNAFYYGRRALQYLNLFMALFVAVAAHGTYDYLAISTSGNGNIAIWLLAYVIILDIICLVIIHRESNNDRPMISNNF